MTCYLALLLIDKWDLHQNNLTFKVSEVAANLSGTTASLLSNDQIFLQDLLYGMMLPSGNDAAQVIAENLGAYLYFEQCHQLYKIRSSGDFFLNEELSQPPKEYSTYFISEMNKLARKLDLRNTLYTNPHGLDHTMNKSTAEDICQLTKIALGNYIFASICKCKSYTCFVREKNGNVRQLIWNSTNQLLQEKGYDGVKTGQTNLAGSCLCSRYQQYDRFIGQQINLLLCVLKCNQTEDRFKDSRIIINWAIHYIHQNYFKSQEIEKQSNLNFS